jgi:D-lactate dehydrogenase
MKIAVFSARKFERDYLLAAFADRHELLLLDTPLTLQSAPLATGCEAVALFVNDDGSEPVLNRLHEAGVRFLLLRSAGFNHVALGRAGALGMRVARVPEYSPYAVAEHTVALMLALNRKLVRAHNRVREMNFTLDGLVGFDMHGRTAGVVGLGKIGKLVAQILRGFGCRVLACDPYPDAAWAAAYGVGELSEKVMVYLD